MSSSERWIAATAFAYIAIAAAALLASCSKPEHHLDLDHTGLIVTDDRGRELCHIDDAGAYHRADEYASINCQAYRAATIGRVSSPETTFCWSNDPCGKAENQTPAAATERPAL